MKKNRLLSCFLALLLLVTPLASCGKGDEQGDDKSTLPSFTEEEGTAPLDWLPKDLNFGNDTVNIISRDRLGWTRGEISVEGLTGDPVNDSVYERGRAVEQRLGVTINSILDPDSDTGTVPDRVNQAVQAGTNDFDIMAACAYTTYPYTISGNFADLADTLYIDLTKPYWTQGYNEAVSYEGMQFSATGSMLLSNFRFAFVTVFNKDLFTNANQPYLYDTVSNGEWTLDKQISLIPVLHYDDGNDKSTAQDIFGLITSKRISVDPYWSSCGLDIIKKNADGALEFVLDRERFHGVTDKLLQLYYETDGGTFAYPGGAGDPEQNDIRQKFAEGKGAMATVRIMELENDVVRNMEDEYGVVPMPKFDVSQEEYHTLLHDQFTVVAIPTTVTDERLDMVSAVLESMSYYGYQIVKPVYYEDTLRTKLASDLDTSLMLDIIVNGIYIDLGIIDTGFGIHSGMREMITKKTNNAASRYQSFSSGVKNRLNDIATSLDRLAAEKE